MRYTKDLQSQVIKEIENGISPSECAEKYNVPLAVIIKWGNIETTEQRAKEIALRKYQEEVSDFESQIFNQISPRLNPNISDTEYLRLSTKVSNMLYSLVSQVVKKERDINPHEDKKSNGELILEIAKKWTSNKLIAKYSELSFALK